MLVLEQALESSIKVNLQFPRGSQGKRRGGNTYLNPKISMHQRLKIPRRLPLIAHHQTSSQALSPQRDAVDQPKSIRPCLLALLAEIAGAESEVELYAVVAGGAGGETA